MKKRLQCLLVLFSITFASNALAQIPWNLNAHSTEIGAFKNEMSIMANSGWTPVGISWNNNQMFVLYLGGNPFNMSAWNLEMYNSTDKLQNGITANMNQGYFPTGISYLGNVFYVIFIKTGSNAQAWQIIPSNADLNSVQNAIQPYISQNYLPCGITRFGNEYYTLLVLIPDTTAKSWEIIPYNAVDIEVQNGVNNAVNKGMVPWGFMYIGNLINVLYVGF